MHIHLIVWGLTLLFNLSHGWAFRPIRWRTSSSTVVPAEEPGAQTPITLMQLENENAESMRKQLKENELKVLKLPVVIMRPKDRRRAVRARARSQGTYSCAQDKANLLKLLSSKLQLAKLDKAARAGQPRPNDNSHSRRSRTLTSASAPKLPPPRLLQLERIASKLESKLKELVDYEESGRVGLSEHLEEIYEIETHGKAAQFRLAGNKSDCPNESTKPPFMVGLFARAPTVPPCLPCNQGLYRYTGIIVVTVDPAPDKREAPQLVQTLMNFGGSKTTRCPRPDTRHSNPPNMGTETPHALQPTSPLPKRKVFDAFRMYEEVLEKLATDKSDYPDGCAPTEEPAESAPTKGSHVFDVVDRYENLLMNLPTSKVPGPLGGCYLTYPKSDARPTQGLSNVFYLCPQLVITAIPFTHIYTSAATTEKDVIILQDYND